MWIIIWTYLLLLFKTKTRSDQVCVRIRRRRRRTSTASYNLHAHKQTHANLTVRFQKLCYFIFGITRQNYSSSFFFRSAHIHCHWYSLMLLLFRQTSKLLSSFKNLKCRYNSMYCQVEKRSLAVALWYILFVFRLLCFFSPFCCKCFAGVVAEWGTSLQSNDVVDIRRARHAGRWREVRARQWRGEARRLSERNERTNTNAKRYTFFVHVKPLFLTTQWVGVIEREEEMLHTFIHANTQNISHARTETQSRSSSHAKNTT